jgi:hypothetical protein
LALSQVRACNAVTHSQDAIFLLPVTGIQGDSEISPGPQQIIDDAERTGLLLLRTYAVTDHKRLVLGMLGVLLCAPIISSVVCIHACISVAVCDGHPLQGESIVDQCSLSNAELHILIM